MTNALHDPLLDATPRAASQAANSWPSIQPQRATNVDAAFNDFLLAMTRPRPLRTLNTRGALDDRVYDIGFKIQEFAKFIAAEIEDTAEHCHMKRRLSDYVIGVLSDLAGDVRGEVIEAMRDVKTA